MAINSRQKGATGERELARVLTELGLGTCRRGCQYRGGADSPDVVSDGGPLDRFHVECKRVERLRLEDALRQSIRDAGTDETPVVIHRRNRGAWLVTMRLTDWADLVRERA